MEEYAVTDRRGQIALIAVVCVIVVMFSLDYSMLGLALPVIAKYFNVKIGAVAWLPMIYILVVTSTLLGFGKLGDTKGYRRVLLLGLVIFLTGTFLCAISRSFSMLLASRAIQALGEAAFAPVTVAILTTFLPSKMRGRALGLLAMSQGIGFTIGPALSGLITSTFTWRAIFLVNIPIGFIMFFAALKAIPSRQPKVDESKFDFSGAFLIFAAVSTALFALNSGVKLGWNNPVIMTCFAVSAVSLVLFIMRERSIAYPLLDLKLFRDKNFAFANAAAFCGTCAYMGAFFLMPFCLEMMRGLEIAKAGSLLVLTPLILMLASPVAGRLSDRIGGRVLCVFGMAAAILAFFLFSRFHTATPIPVIAGAFLAGGVAMGSFFAPNNKLVMANAPEGKHGVASGVYKICLNIGSVLGIAIMPVVIYSRVSGMIGSKGIALAQLKDHPDILAAGFSAAFQFGMFVCLAGLIFSLLAKEETCRT